MLPVVAHPLLVLDSVDRVITGLVEHRLGIDDEDLLGADLAEGRDPRLCRVELARYRRCADRRPTRDGCASAGSRTARGSRGPLRSRSPGSESSPRDEPALARPAPCRSRGVGATPGPRRPGSRSAPSSRSRRPPSPSRRASRRPSPPTSCVAPRAERSAVGAASPPQLRRASGRPRSGAAPRPRCRRRSPSRIETAIVRRS